jgi:hypothetical protein
MSPDKTHTYDPKDFKWTMDNVVTETSDTILPASDLPLEVKPLEFFWWLNPWKHMELLFDAYRHHAEVANEWRDLYHLKAKLWKADASERDDVTERLNDELDTMRSERDAANQAVRFLRNKSKKGKRRG